MTRTAILIGLGIVAVAETTFAQPFSPNHLEPIPAYDRDGYDQAVFHALIGRGLPELWMVCKPSFSPEYAVILRSETFGPDITDRLNRVKQRKWVLERATASKQIVKCAEAAQRLESVARTARAGSK